MRKSFIIAITLVLCGCSLISEDFYSNIRRDFSSYGDKAPSTITNEQITNSEFAYIIGRFNGRNEWVNTLRKYNDSFSKFDVVELNYFENPFTSNAYDIFMLKPGKYTLIFYSVPYKDSFINNTEASKKRNEIIKQYSSMIASFEVEKGKIYYVGDMELKPNKLKVQSNEWLMLDYIKKNYPNIARPQEMIVYLPIEKGEFYTSVEE